MGHIWLPSNSGRIEACKMDCQGPREGHPGLNIAIYSKSYGQNMDIYGPIHGHIYGPYIAIYGPYTGQWIAIGQSASRLGCILPIAYWLAWHPNRAISKWFQSARRLHFLNQASVSISFMEPKSELIRWSQSVLKVLQDSMRFTLAQHLPPIECFCRLASPSSDCKGAPTAAHWKALPTAKSGG